MRTKRLATEATFRLAETRRKVRGGDDGGVLDVASAELLGEESESIIGGVLDIITDSTQVEREKKVNRGVRNAEVEYFA